jgi:hypothetical protein
MRAHRARVRVSENHELRVTLPSDFPPGDAEVIVLEASSENSAERVRKLTVDELLAAKLTPPAGVGRVTLTDMEEAIAVGVRSQEAASSLPMRDQPALEPIQPTRLR